MEKDPVIQYLTAIQIRVLIVLLGIFLVVAVVKGILTQ